MAGAKDIELGSPRSVPVRYRLTLPQGFSPGDPIKGLVLFIPGFGKDKDAGYIESFSSWVADTHGLACLAVGYHAYGCRPGNGAERRFTQPDADRLVSACTQHGVAMSQGDGPGVLLDKLHRAYRAKVAAGKATGMITMTCGLVAQGGEKQNFGLMQALDHLHVLADLRQKLAYDRRNVIAIGSSHGGYLAQLIAKLAPNTLRAVFDNAGYATPPRRYINGREANLPDYIERYSDVMQMYFFLESMWSFEQVSPNYYHADAHALRSLSEPTHLETMAKTGTRRTRYRCVHGPDDAIAPTHEKAAYCQQLTDAGFDAQYQCMGPEDVDGRYVKSLDHGCGLSLRGFFERSYATLPESDLSDQDPARSRDDFEACTDLSYTGPTRVYRFSFSDQGVSSTLEPIVAG